MLHEEWSSANRFVCCGLERMSELSSILNLLEVRVNALNTQVIPSSKNRRQIENLATVLHGKKSSSGSAGSSGSHGVSSMSPSSPRNFFLRRAVHSQNNDGTTPKASPLSAAMVPDESIREFNISSNPNRIFIAGGTVWEQVVNSSEENPGAAGPRTSGAGRYVYTKKNILLFNDVLLLCHVSEDDDIVGAASASGDTRGSGSKSHPKSRSSSNASASNNSRKSPTPMNNASSPPVNYDAASSSTGREVNDGTEFANIDLDDVDELKSLVKRGHLQLQRVVYIKSMKLYDMPPVNADRSAFQSQQRPSSPVNPVAGYASGLGTPAGEGMEDHFLSPGLCSDYGVGGGSGGGATYNVRRYHRFEILYHLPYHERGVNRHNRSIVLCSQQSSVCNKYREELRRTMIGYHMQYSTSAIMATPAGKAGQQQQGDKAVVQGQNLNQNHQNQNLGGMGVPSSIQSHLRLGWMYGLFGGTIFEASYSGDVRALRNHLDHMSTYNGNFYSGGASGAVHALSPANLDLSMKDTSRGRVRTATQDSAGSGSTPHNVLLNSGIGGNNMVLNKSYYIDSLDQFGMTALHWACMHGHTICARLLVDFGADMNVRQQRGGNTCLIIAASCGHADVVSLLLHQNSYANRSFNRTNATTRIEIRNYAGHNAVEMALFCSHVRVRQALSEAKAKQASGSEREAIVMREKQCLQQILSALYSHGANFNEEDASGNTPLYLCVYYNLKYGIEILMDLLGQGGGGLSNSASTGSNKPKGNSSNTLDESNASERIFNNNINFNAVHPQHRCTALQLACSRVLNVYDVDFEELHLGTVEIIRLLISGGAYVNWKNKNATKGGPSSSTSKSNRNKTDSYGNGDGMRSTNTSDSGGNGGNGSRRNSRESLFSEHTSQTSSHYAGIIQEEYDSADERESYTYGRASDAGSTRGSQHGSQSQSARSATTTGSKYSSAKDSHGRKRHSSDTIGAWTPLQILQRTFVQVKLEEIEVLNTTNVYSAGANVGSGATTPRGPSPMNDHGPVGGSVLDFTMGSDICVTPNPTFYGAANHPVSIRSPRSPSLSSPAETPSPFQNNPHSSLLGGAGGDGTPASQGGSQGSSGKGSPTDANATGVGGFGNAFSPANTDKIKQLSTVVFQAILVLIKAGAQWKDKDLIETVRGLQAVPPKRPAGGSGYGSDRNSGYSSGGYGSGAERRSEHAKKHTGGSQTKSKDMKHHLLLTKPSLKYALDECADEWRERNEPANFEEFVCSRQAMGDVLYQLKKNWQDDSDQNHCELCVGKFTSISNRRHHCRSCGVLVCDKCSSKRLSLAVLPPSSSSVSGNDASISVTKERTCDACFNQLCQQVSNTQSANNRYCVKQLKASAELLLGRLQQFLESLGGEDQEDHLQVPVSRPQSNNTSNNRSSSSGNMSRDCAPLSKSPRRRSKKQGHGNGSSRENSHSNSNNSGRPVINTSNSGGGVYDSDSSDDPYGELSNTSPLRHGRRSPDSRKVSTPTKIRDADTKHSLFTPPKRTVTSSARRNDIGKGSSSNSNAGESGKSNLFFCPGGSNHRAEGGGPASPVRLSLIENDVGLYKFLQHRHLIKQQVDVLLECDFLAQTFLDASRMYQVEAEAHTT